jgi:hypothetical protein
MVRLDSAAIKVNPIGESSRLNNRHPQDDLDTRFQRRRTKYWACCKSWLMIAAFHLRPQLRVSIFVSNNDSHFVDLSLIRTQLLIFILLHLSKGSSSSPLGLSSSPSYGVSQRRNHHIEPQNHNSGVTANQRFSFRLHLLIPTRDRRPRSWGMLLNRSGHSACFLERLTRSRSICLSF